MGRELIVEGCLQTKSFVYISSKTSIESGQMTSKVQLTKDDEIWYSNASKKGNSAGGRVSTRRRAKGIIILLNRYPTIMQAEMIGIEAAAQLGIRKGSRRIVHIFCDNKTALTALENITMESNLTLE